MRFNYLGEIDNQLEENLFTVADQRYSPDISQENSLPNLMEMNLYIVNSSLCLFYIINNSLSELLDTDAFFDRTIKNIERISDYCTGREAIDYTPSDFNIKELSIEDMDSLFET